MTSGERKREALIARYQTSVDQLSANEKAAKFVEALSSTAACSVAIDQNSNSFFSGYIQLVRARVDNRRPHAEYNFIQNTLRESSNWLRGTSIPDEIPGQWWTCPES
jgi:hypothetical protein